MVEPMQNVELKLVDATELRTTRGGPKKNGAKYNRYATAVEKHVSYLKNAIESSRDGVIRIKNSEMAKALGGEFVKRNPTSIYWGLKYVLFSKYIVVDTATHKSGEKILVMRARKPGDTLPASLSKYLEEAEADDDVGTEKTGTEGEEISNTIDEMIGTGAEVPA